MLQVLYVSSAAKGLTQEAVEAILAASRVRNAAAQLTGMLLYAGDNFLQVLEGPEAAVDALFSIIKRDPRHARVMVLLRRSVMDRNFAKWSMGFERTTAHEHPDLDVAFRIGRSEIESRLTTTEADQIMTLLGAFYNVATRDGL